MRQIHDNLAGHQRGIRRVVQVIEHVPYSLHVQLRLQRVVVIREEGLLGDVGGHELLEAGLVQPEEGILLLLRLLSPLEIGEKLALRFAVLLTALAEGKDH